MQLLVRRYRQHLAHLQRSIGSSNNNKANITSDFKTNINSDNEANVDSDNDNEANINPDFKPNNKKSHVSSYHSQAIKTPNVSSDSKANKHTKAPPDNKANKKSNNASHASSNSQAINTFTIISFIVFRILVVVSFFLLINDIIIAIVCCLIITEVDIHKTLYPLCLSDLPEKEVPLTQFVQDYGLVSRHHGSHEVRLASVGNNHASVSSSSMQDQRFFFFPRHDAVCVPCSFRPPVNYSSFHKRRQTVRETSYLELF
jgi:hypothetical protein